MEGNYHWECFPERDYKMHSTSLLLDPHVSAFTPFLICTMLSPVDTGQRSETREACDALQILDHKP